MIRVVGNQAKGKQMSTQRSERRFTTIDVLNITTLSVAVVSLLLIGTVSLVLSNYLWPQVVHCVKEIDPERLWMPAIRICMGSDLIQFGLFFAAAVLIGKEFLLHRKAISLAINGVAAIGCLGYSVFYILVPQEAYSK